ncbi:hypothetical protein GIB67_028997, partial [Kingdonia uniflora]
WERQYLLFDLDSWVAFLLHTCFTNTDIHKYYFSSLLKEMDMVDQSKTTKQRRFLVS